MELGNREFGVVFDENGNLVNLYIPTGDGITVPQIMIDLAVKYLGVDPSDFENNVTIH